MHNLRFLVPVAVLAWCIVAIIGCHGKTPAYGTVQGRVTLAGEPFSAGSIVFTNTELGIARMTNLGPNGEFVLRSHNLAGLPVGTYHVCLSPHRVSDGEFVPVQPPARGAVGAAAVPARYLDPATSGWTAEIREGTNPALVFELEP